MNIETMLDEYTNWLRKEMTITEIGEYYELTTPYLDRFNDYLQIYVKMNKDGTISMTDDGYILSNLYSSGIKFKKGSKRKVILDRILNNYGIEQKEDDLYVTCNPNNFAQKKHLMVQAMLAIDDMFELRSDSVKDMFVEDVAMFLDEKEIYYTRDFSMIGKTGSLYTYDFLFQKSKNQPERFCRGINRLRESNRNMAIFNWIDTKEKRIDESELILFINDANQVNSEDIEAFEKYEIKPVLYSEREKNIKLFQVS